MSPRSWFPRAGLQPVAIATGILTCLVLLPFTTVFAGASENTRWAVFSQAGFQAGLLAGLVGALQPRTTPSPRPRRAVRELAHGSVLAVGAAAGVGLALALGLTLAGLSDLAWQVGLDLPRPGALLIISEPWPVGVMAIVVGCFAALATVVSFIVCRGVRLAWFRWDQLRRTRLRWALTHSLLVASLIVAVLIATFLSASAIIFGDASPAIRGILSEDAPRIERFLVTIVSNYVPAGIVLVLAPLIIGIVIVPPAALIAFPVLGRATRRLEALIATTGALRTGGYSARTPVSGEDEIARLQADFNAMAADLERTLDELRAERDAVGRLLHDRRQLVASVSHELRTPLATLRGYLDSALEHFDGGPSATLRQDLAIMSAETDRLHHLIDDLFTLSRAEVGHLRMTLQPTAGGPLLRRIVAAAAPLAWTPGRVEIVAQIPDDLPLARVDPERLEQIVRNLIINAVRHTPPGGLVLVSAEPVADTLTIQVRDTGEGIAAADLPLIWDRFYRAGNARNGSGAGLGLALVRELAEAMGGAVTAASTTGEGSCFTIQLPLVTSRDREPATQSSSASRHHDSHEAGAAP